MMRINRQIALSFLSLLILATASYLWIDQPLARFCHVLIPGITQLFQWVTELGKSTPYLIGFLLLFAFFKYIRRWPMAARRFLFLFAGIALSGLASDVIKPLAGRFRPKLLFESNLFGFEPFRLGYEYNSFPSGHAATIFALAAALALLFPRWRIPLFILAAVVGLSRLIVGAHYLSDVLAGAYVGVMTVYLLTRLCRRRGWNIGAMDGAQEGRHA